MRIFHRSAFRGVYQTESVSYAWRDLPLRMQILAALCFSLVFITALLAFISGLRAALVSGGACFLCWAALIPMLFKKRRGVPGAVSGAFAFVGALLIALPFLVPRLIARFGVRAAAVTGVYALCGLFFVLGAVLLFAGVRRKMRAAPDTPDASAAPDTSAAPEAPAAPRDTVRRALIGMGAGYMVFGLAAAVLCRWLLGRIWL